jgi:hypothetical protein
MGTPPIMESPYVFISKYRNLFYNYSIIQVMCYIKPKLITSAITAKPQINLK